MPKLTKKVVEAADAGTTEYMLWDGELPGFGVRVFPSGKRSYLVQYRVGRRSRRITLGPHGVLTPDQARGMAMKALSEVRHGGDPARERKERRDAVTVQELSARFDAEHIAVRIKESTAREYRRNLRRFILPVLGRHRVTDVTRADVAKFHHDLRHIPYQQIVISRSCRKCLTSPRCGDCVPMGAIRVDTSASILSKSGSDS